MSEFITTIRVRAVRAAYDGEHVYDWGILKWKAGDWLLEGADDCPLPIFQTAMSDAEFREHFKPITA